MCIRDRFSKLVYPSTTFAKVTWIRSRSKFFTMLRKSEAALCWFNIVQWFLNIEPVGLFWWLDWLCAAPIAKTESAANIAEFGAGVFVDIGSAQKRTVGKTDTRVLILVSRRVKNKRVIRKIHYQQVVVFRLKTWHFWSSFTNDFSSNWLLCDKPGVPNTFYNEIKKNHIQFDQGFQVM